MLRVLGTKRNNTTTTICTNARAGDTSVGFGGNNSTPLIQFTLVHISGVLDGDTQRANSAKYNRIYNRVPAVQYQIPAKQPTNVATTSSPPPPSFIQLLCKQKC
ncbi:unnamed protein product [Ceratitis capitata]|uniref:(Mediterranean fruit fly) hypothetical protein n=1 Tax=Ceratitis capitata TaxID=7213 RepID=A0A811UZQ0_CERCA|nr:unnamed protein product [Ceratitis capitata]